MERVLSIIAFLSISFCSIAQNEIEYPVFKGKYSFEVYMASLLTSEVLLNQECREFMCALQFNIDKKGNIDEGSIKISEYVQGHLRLKIKEFLNTTHGTWEPMKVDRKARRSNPQLLIMHFEMEGGCDKQDNYGSKSNILNEFKNIFNYGDSITLPPQNARIFPTISVHYPLGHLDLGDVLEDN